MTNYSALWEPFWQETNNIKTVEQAKRVLFDTRIKMTRQTTYCKLPRTTTHRFKKLSFCQSFSCLNLVCFLCWFKLNHRLHAWCHPYVNSSTLEPLFLYSSVLKEILHLLSQHTVICKWSNTLGLEFSHLPNSNAAFVWNAHGCWNAWTLSGVGHGVAYCLNYLHLTPFEIRMYFAEQVCFVITIVWRSGAIHISML